MDVDLVYTYVNANDEAWHEKRTSYARAEVKKDFSYRAGATRFQDNGELKYSLRSVERHVPFIRRIYVVHAGEAPRWLVHDRADLVFVPQDDILPAEYAPSFQSDLIEAFIHRIPGLSEHYVYANDDFFFARPHLPSDFFDAAGRARVGMDWRLAGTGLTGSATYRSMETNAARAVRRHLRLDGVHATTRPRLKQRLWLLYNRGAVLNTVSHVAHPFRKSMWKGFHEVFAAEIRELAKHRFRSEHGLTVNLMAHHYAIANDFAVFTHVPNKILYRGSSLEEANRFKAGVVQGSEDWTRFCLNDRPSDDQFDWELFVAGFMDEYLPKPSRWETA